MIKINMNKLMLVVVLIIFIGHRTPRYWSFYRVCLVRVVYWMVMTHLWRTRCEKCLLDSDASFIWLLHTTSRPVHIENMHLYKKDGQWPTLTRSGHKVSQGELIDSVTTSSVIVTVEIRWANQAMQTWTHTCNTSRNDLGEFTERSDTFIEAVKISTWSSVLRKRKQVFHSIFTQTNNGKVNVFKYSFLLLISVKKS
jgi:hypothetical protein